MTAAVGDPARIPPRGRRRWLVLAGLTLLTCLLILARFGPGTDMGRQLIEQEANGLDFGSLGRLRVEGLTGDPWSNPRLARLTFSDRNGIWLDARDVALDWRPSELLQRRVRATALSVADLTLFRRPNAAAQRPSGGKSPVSVRLDAIRARIQMTPAFALRQGDYDLQGALDVERSGALSVHAAAKSRLHAGDHLNVRLDVDRDKSFRLDADALEAEGGALAGMLGLAADKPFLLDARAAGSIRQGHVHVDTHVGETSPLQVNGAWTPAGGSARGVIELGASSLLAHYRDIVGPTLQFSVSGHRAVDGFSAFDLGASGQYASLSANGEGDFGSMKAGPKGLAVDARVAETNRLLSFPKMGAGRLVGTLSGDRSHWKLTGSAMIENVAEGPYSLARVSGPLQLENQGRDLLIEAQPTGVGGAGQGLLAALLGARPSGVAELTRFADGRLLMRRLALQGVGLKATATGTRGLLGDLAFTGDASFSNLAMANRGAKGLVNFAWTARQSGRDPWALTVDAHGQDFNTGMAEADRLLGRTPHLLAQGQWGEGALALSSVSLTGAAGETSGAGSLGDDGSLALKLVWKANGQFEAGPLEFVGTAKGTGDLAGTWEAPKLDLVADFGSVSAPNLPLTDAHLVLTFQRTPSGGDGNFNLKAASAYGVASAASNFRFIDDGLQLTDLDIKGGGVTAQGALALRAGEPSSADLAIAIGPGTLLTEGAAQGHIQIAGAASGANADISLQGGEAVLRDGAVKIKKIAFSASGPLARLPYKIAANGPSEAGPWRVNGSGELVMSGADRRASFSGAARLRRSDFRTLNPVEVRFDDNGYVGHANIGAGSGRADISIASRSGSASLDATLADIDMALLDEDYVGKLSGRLTLAGAGDRLNGALDARLSGAGGRDLRGAPPVNGEILAKLAGQIVNVRFDLGNSAGLKAEGNVSLPVDASAAPFAIAVNSRRPMSGHFSVNGEIKPIWDLLLTGADTLSGQVNASLTLGGTLADPRAVGQVALDNGRFQDEDSGLQLQNVSLRANLADYAVNVSHFTAVDGAKGQISGSGQASLARDGASSFRAELTGFRLIDTDLARATASGPITVNRAANGKVQIAGTLTIDNAQISPNPPVASGVTPMDVVEIHRPDELDDQPGLNGNVTAREAPLGLDVSIRAPGKVYLKGRGLNLELALDAHVVGTAASPVLTGNARVVRGDYDFAGQRFQLDDRSVIYLGSTPQAIRLDLTATREDPSLTAVIKISGTAAKPVISLSSNPALPQDEILSQVLFGASASQLSGLEAAQLASAVAGLSGGGGFDLIGGLRSLAHLDRLAVADSTVTGTTVSGGKYITDRLYLQLTGGGREGQGAQLEWRVRKRLSLVGKLGSQGDSQIAIRWRKSY